MDINQAFTTFLTESPKTLSSPTDSVDSVSMNAHNVEDPKVLEAINGYLTTLSGRLLVNGYFLVNKIRIKLMEIGLQFGDVSFVGDSGKVKLPMTQYGGRYGQLSTGSAEISSDDGIKNRLPSGLDIEFSWLKVKGLYMILAQLVP